ncbi:MAG: S24/S26 family peptidase [Clostridia bacterium]|nr:S24/S26 family peptidase [Clostridia bacterium]MBQ6859908.1 S24/S26 family peptidase [Clostridia bacterium]MBQ7052937.1 S24/S26 family peptidase [Clostridia bacterium]
MLKGLVEEGKEVSIIVTGSSMNPFLIHQRDTVFFRRPDRPLRRGDIVFYQRDNGQYVLHRIVRVRGDMFDIIGDAQTEIEFGVRREQIFALITKVKRKGKLIRPGDFWWMFFERVWLRMIPLRRIISVVYGKTK